jgi:hypothetical protein
MDQKLLQFLDIHNISYIPYTHEAVFTVEEANKIFSDIV